MQPTKKIILTFASLALMFAASTVAQTRDRSPQRSPSPTETKSPSPIETKSPSPTETKSPSPESETTPVSRPSPADLASPSEEPTAATRAAAATPASQTPPPKPILYLMSTEAYSAGGKNWIRHRYDVANKSSYPADMFAAAPSLPACGSNTNSSRTWVDFFDSTGKRLYGFCALSKPEDLGKIWVSFEEGTVPPSYVYIELNDRQTNTKYKSNLAETTL